MLPRITSLEKKEGLKVAVAKGPLREPGPEQEKTTHCDAMYAQRVAPWD